jgi:AcrR family transcriptional regulator
MLSDDPRQRLLEAAGEVFAEKGFKGATVKAITDRAGANIAAVNYYFRDKEGLYVEAVKSACHCQNQQFPLPDWAPGTSPVQKLADFIRTMASRMTDNSARPWQRQLMLQEMASPSPACTELVRDVIRPMAEKLGDIVGELLPDAPPRKRNLVAFSVVGQCLYYRLAQPIVVQLVGEEEFRNYDADLLAGHITEFSLAALGLRPPVAGKRSAEDKLAANGAGPSK